MLVEALTPEAVRRFMERVEVHDGSDCWLYMGDLERDRPRVTINGVKAEAYRWSWAIAMQADPTPGMLLLHSCDTSRCVNPTHLREGTYSENNADAVERDRVRNQYTDRTECKRGHRLDEPDSLYISPRGKRECARCRRLRSRGRG